MSTTNSSNYERTKRQRQSIAVKQVVKSFLRDSGVKPMKSWKTLAEQLSEVLGRPIPKGWGRVKSRDYIESWIIERGRGSLIVSGKQSKKNTNKRAKREASRDKKKYGKSFYTCLLYTSPSPRDQRGSRMPSSA